MFFLSPSEVLILEEVGGAGLVHSFLPDHLRCGLALKSVVSSLSGPQCFIVPQPLSRQSQAS